MNAIPPVRSIMTSSSNPLFQEKYDFIFSIGEACSCSSTLRNAGLQHRSMPFDWVARPSLVERAKLFHDNFQNWLPKEAMECVGKQLIEKKPKLIYRNTITGTVFNHDFPLDVPFEEAYPIVKARHDRRIARLYETIRSSRSVLMVNLAPPNETKDQSNEDLVAAQKIVSDYFPGVKIHLLHVFNKDDIALEDAEVGTPAPGVFTLKFCYNAFNPEVPHLVNDDILYRLFHKIRLSSRHLTFIDSLNKWSAQHPILNFFFRSRITRNGMQTIEVLRIRICRIKAKKS